MSNFENFDLDELTALARLDIEQSRVEQALGKLKFVLSTDAAPTEALSMAARLYAQLGLFERAKVLFERYLSIRPDAVEEEFQLGMVQLDKGESEQALATWEGMLKRLPTFPPGLFYSALILNRQGKMAEAIRNLDVLLQTAPADNLYFGRSKELLASIERGVVHQLPTLSQAYQS
ncbi:MAG: tetratricopeptide repeat protein [Pseudomonadota bacterium]